MRRKFAFGLGLAGVLSGAGAGLAQFAVDRPPTPPVSPTAPASPAAPPALPSGVRPIGLPAPPSGVTPASGLYRQDVAAGTTFPEGMVTPASVSEPAATPPPRDLEIRSALGANHPWQLKPEHGAYFICVKSYSRPSRPAPDDKGLSARELAEGLAGDIRELYKVQALLYEYVSPERKAEMAAIAAARERARVFASQLDKYKQQAALQGMEFLEPDTRVHYKTVNYQEQVAVLVGGFKSEEEARKALDTIRTWPAPKNKTLLDGAIITRPGKDGKLFYEQSHLNPYLTATVVPNPTIARNAGDPAQAAAVDPFIVKLNEGRPYNLLKAKKSWTLGVKSFTAPVEIVSKDSSGGGLMKPFSAANKGADVLRAGAEQAEQLAAALRSMKGRGCPPDGFEAFVLHTRTASLVTIGQFDSPNDPALLQLKQLLTSMKLSATEDKAGTRPVGNGPELFTTMLPVPIPH